MRSLFTTVTKKPSIEKITHKHNILMIGSCFSNEIGNKFFSEGFSTYINPFGILYNPISIAECLERIAKKEFFNSNDLIYNNGYYYLFAAHGDYRATDQQTLLEIINNVILKAHEYLEKTDYIFITLGTAMTYWYTPLNTLLGNCHKLDNKLIERRLVPYKDIATKFSETLLLLRNIFGNKHHIIFTVSPIRHWKEGYRDNLISKSHLHLAIEELIKMDNSLDYFPSYEIVMDTLRDYRFYSEDMLHINSTAVDYIWEVFSDVYFSAETIELNSQFRKLWLMQNHRAINPKSELYQRHLDKIERTKKELQPYTNLQL